MRSLRHQRRHGPPPELADAPLNPLIGLRRFIDDTPLPDGRMIPAKIGAHLARLAELAHGYGVCTLSVEHLAAKGHRCERTIKRYAKYLRDNYLIIVTPRLRENGSCSTNEIRINWDYRFFDGHLRKRCSAETSASGTVTKQSLPDESPVVIGVYQSPSLMHEKKPIDPKPEPIHEAKQRRMFDNVYSVNTAEKPINTAIPDVPHVLAFRKTIANWFNVTLSFQLTLWLLGFLLVRRWSITAFLRDIDRNHKPRLFHSQDAAWRFMVADYQNRGPVLESYPPPESPPRAVAEESSKHSAVSSQLADESPPPANPVIVKRQSMRPSMRAEAPPGPRISDDRVDELLVEYGVPNAAFYRWLEIARPPRIDKPWPISEAGVRSYIELYKSEHSTGPGPES